MWCIFIVSFYVVTKSEETVVLLKKQTSSNSNDSMIFSLQKDLEETKSELGAVKTRLVKSESQLAASEEQARYWICLSFPIDF